jgi:hypothetical protein
MTTLPKILLTVAITGLCGGAIIDYHYTNANPGVTAVLPLGAIAFGLFLISLMMQGEMAKFDEEQAKKMQLLEGNTAATATRKERAIPLDAVRLQEKTS